MSLRDLTAMADPNRIQIKVFIVVRMGHLIIKGSNINFCAGRQRPDGDCDASSRIRHNLSRLVSTHSIPSEFFHTFQYLVDSIRIRPDSSVHS